MTYWDRLARLYSDLGRADFWFRHRLRLLDGVCGRALEACCGGGQLAAELRRRGVSVCALDLSRPMLRLAQRALAGAGAPPGDVLQADVTRLPFAEASFDFVIVTGALGLLPRRAQQAALGELARVCRGEVRLLEPVERQPGLYPGRVLAFLFDGMRPIRRDDLAACGLDVTIEWGILGAAFSYARCARRRVQP